MPTRKYLVIQRCAPGAQRSPSPAQIREMHAAFAAWTEKFAANIVDMGARLEPSGKVLTSSGVTDGPFAEAKEVVGGYMVITAESYDGAMQVARECPGLVTPGSSTEIRAMAGP